MKRFLFYNNKGIEDVDDDRRGAHSDIGFDRGRNILESSSGLTGRGLFPFDFGHA